MGLKSYSSTAAASKPRTYGAGIVIPHVADANARLSLTAEGVVVSGAGTAECNGTYTQRGIQNERPYYNLSNFPDNNFEAAVYWDSISWHVNKNNGQDAYQSFDDVVYPWLVTTWAEVNGALPLPTVTHSPGQVTGAGYRVIQDDGPTTYEFLGAGADADAGVWVTLAGTASWNGPYIFNGTDRYELIADAGATRLDFVVDRWAMGGDYINIGNATYAWSMGWQTVVGTPPAPTVTRDPLTSENNWAVVP